MSSKEKSGGRSRSRAQGLSGTEAKKRESFVPYFILLLIAGYAVFLLISTQVEIQKKKNEYEVVNARLTDMLAANEQLERYLESDEHIYEYMESIARGKLSYAHPRERIYYIMPSS